MAGRRSFIKRAGTGALLLGAGQFPLSAMSSHELVRLTILHTNDVHSRIDPFPMDGGRNEGMGGAERRASLIEKIRTKEKNVLLLDAGDMFQGTPYFNFYGGELEIKLMSKMGYDAGTIGNHDFDGGIEGLAKQLQHANFPLISSNYDFDDSPMNGKSVRNQVFEYDGIKIGVTGVGIELDGLVPANLMTGTRYLDPIENVNKEAKFLRHEMGCDYVICLSHIGYSYTNESRFCDRLLVPMTEDIDLIIGGHTHTFMNEPKVLKNKNGDPVLVNQVGWAGIMLGRLDVFFERSKKGKCSSCQNIYLNRNK